MNIKITIGGCRDYNDYETFCSFAEECINEHSANDITVLSGHCSGVDMMAERFANEKGYSLEIHPAQWNRYGKAAGPIRNKIMVEKSDLVIAYWDYKSKGTRDLIECAEKLNKPIKIKKIAPTHPTPHPARQIVSTDE